MRSLTFRNCVAIVKTDGVAFVRLSAMTIMLVVVLLFGVAVAELIVIAAQGRSPSHGIFLRLAMCLLLWAAGHYYYRSVLRRAKEKRECAKH